MNVKELIEFLSKFPENTRIVVRSGNYEMNGAIVDAGVYTNTYIKARETFRDDFDGGLYRSDVYQHSEDGEIAVVIYG